MSENGHHHLHVDRRYEEREVTHATRRRLGRMQPAPGGKRRWLWLVGLTTGVAALAALFLRLESTPVDYAVASVLLGSIGALAFVSASRALNVGLRYEESVQYVEEVEENYRSLRRIFCTALDMRDCVTGGHSERVAAMSLEMGQLMGLPEGRLQRLEWAAFLHDIGKVLVSEDILVKPGPLDPDEWQEMQQHPHHSYSILAQVDSLQDAAEIVYCHHERFDGMGYPRGLKGEEIPTEARIFAVVDAYDAMVSERPYRDPFSHEGAVNEILMHAGTQFDPEVAKVFAQWAAGAPPPGFGPRRSSPASDSLPRRSDGR